MYSHSPDVLSFEDIEVSDGMLELVVRRSGAAVKDSDPQISWIMIVSNKEIDKIELSNQIELVNLELDKELYTEDSWKELEEALAEAMAIRDYGFATQKEVDDIIDY